MLDVNVNFHYLCPVASNVKLYPLFGLTLSNWMFDMYDVDVGWGSCSCGWRWES